MWEGAKKALDDLKEDLAAAEATKAAMETNFGDLAKAVTDM